MENIDVMLEPVHALLNQIGAYMPRLVIALGAIILGWLIAKAIRYSLVKALRALNFHVLTERAGVDGFLQQSGTEKGTTEVIGWIAYATVLLVSLIIAFNSLGLMQVTDLLSKLLLFVPKILVALLIIVFGSYFARFVGTGVQNYCRSAGISDGDLLGRVARYAVLTFVLLLAMENVEISGGLIQQTFLIILAGFVFAGALAFGLGARNKAEALLDRWFPQDRGDRTP
jgi:flagellar biosynthesis protein FliQ